ncbi:hypothetical protein, partial [Streptomyces kunmingensis]
ASLRDAGSAMLRIADGSDRSAIRPGRSTLRADLKSRWLRAGVDLVTEGCFHPAKKYGISENSPPLLSGLPLMEQPVCVILFIQLFYVLRIDL